jgi:mannose-6-phosphate isomerase class I
LSTEIEEKIFTYIATLEKTNEELLNTLKKCVELLTKFTPSVPDRHGWQDMLNTFQETIKVGERIVVRKSTLH